MGDALGRRHREAGRMDEGEQLQQVEAGQIGIAEPVADQRRVQHDHRRFGRARDRLAAADRLDVRRPARRSRCRHGLREAPG